MSGGGQYSGEGTASTPSVAAAAAAVVDVFSEEEYDDPDDAAILDSLAADFADYDDNDDFGAGYDEQDGVAAGQPGSAATPEMPPLPGAQQHPHLGADVNGNGNGLNTRGGLNSNGTEAIASTIATPAYVTTGQLNQHDVLCGRGQGINDNPGNLHFRSVVSARKAEYVQAPTNKKKSEIAREVIRRIRFELSPPGRFLKRATPDDVRRLGIDDATIARAAAEDSAHHGGGGDGAAGDAGSKTPCGIWIPVTEAVMMERAKMSLRRQEGGDQRDRVGQQSQQQQQPPAAVAMAVHVGDGSDSGSVRRSSESSLNAAQLMMNSSMGTLGSSVPRYGSPSGRAGVDHSHSSMHTSGSSLSNFDANVLALVAGASKGGAGAIWRRLLRRLLLLLPPRPVRASTPARLRARPSSPPCYSGSDSSRGRGRGRAMP